MSYNTTHRNPLLMFSRWLGLAAAIATSLLYCIFVFVNPYTPEGVTTGTYVVSVLMILLALLAIWGAFSLKPLLLFLAFLGSFVPVGLYFLGTPGIFAFIGVANLLYLFAAILMTIGRRGTTR